MLPPIELLYNERYEIAGGAGQEHGPIYTLARVQVHQKTDSITIDVPEAGRIYLTHEGWATLAQQIKQRFEEVQDGNQNEE